MAEALPTDPTERLEALRERLTPLQFDVTQRAGTEPAFTGIYWDDHADRVYGCIGYGAPLLSAPARYESGSGRPSLRAVGG